MMWPTPSSAVAVVAWLLLASVVSIPASGADIVGPSSLDFVAPPVEATDEAVEKATGLVISSNRLPLQTHGRYIIDSLGGRVKWSCVNWHGAQQRSWVTGGLHKQKVRVLAARIASLGFNCVRLSYSTEAVVKNPIVPADRVAANPELFNKTFIECLDAVVEALTKEHVMIILNNHMNKAGWCCTIDQDDGFWYTPGFNESTWMGALMTIAERYKNNLWVVAHDLRNEPHSVNGRQLTWGGGDPKTDYKMVMEKVGNAVLAIDPGSLIVIEGLCFGMELRFLKHSHIGLNLPNRIVYEVHNYQEFQFSTLFTSHFYAWSFVRKITGLVAFCLVTLFFCVIYSCHRLRWPWAPKGVFLVTFGSWVSAISGPGLVGAVVAHFYYTKYCNFVAEFDVHPYIWLAVQTLVAGMIMLVGGFVRFGAFGPKYQRFCKDGDRDVILGSTSDSDRSENASDSGSDASDEPELACLHAFVRAKDGQNGGGPCCFGGFASCREIRTRSCGKRWKKRNTKLNRVEWDCGVCLLWQMFCGIPAVLVILTLVWFYALSAPMYRELESELDRKWGFVLQDGHPYTAPVWMGEFGAGQKGTYWVNFVKYLSERDLDFAYWPLNADKLAAGFFDDWGNWNPYPNGEQWDEDTYSILGPDYMTVRAPWRLLDLHPLMESPSGAVLNSQPCQRDVLGRVCGG